VVAVRDAPEALALGPPGWNCDVGGALRGRLSFGEDQSLRGAADGHSLVRRIVATFNQQTDARQRAAYSITQSAPALSS